MSGRMRHLERRGCTSGSAPTTESCFPKGPPRRGLRSATYVSVLVRSHLRHLTRFPKEELAALKRSVAELGTIGRSLNQIARAANQEAKVAGPGREDLRSMLKVAEALRDHVKALIRNSPCANESTLRCSRFGKTAPLRGARQVVRQRIKCHGGPTWRKDVAAPYGSGSGWLIKVGY
jgi:hypothetical protein